MPLRFGPVEGAVLAKDGRFEVHELAAGLDTQLLDEPLAKAPVGAQGVPLPP